MGLFKKFNPFNSNENPTLHIDLPMFGMFGLALGAIIFGLFYALLASLWGESGVIFSVKYLVVGLKYLATGLIIIALTMTYWWFGPRRKGAVIWQLNAIGVVIMIVVAISSLCNFWYGLF